MSNIVHLYSQTLSANKMLAFLYYIVLDNSLYVSIILPILQYFIILFFWWMCIFCMCYKEGERGRGGRGKGKRRGEGKEGTPKGWLTPPYSKSWKIPWCVILNFSEHLLIRTITFIDFVHVNGRSLYIVDWRMVVVVGGNTLHHVKRERKCPG